MTDPYSYSYDSPLKGWEGETTAKKSDAYTSFVHPIENSRGFDVHVYYFQSDPAQVKFATELYTRVRREFPELRIGKLWDKPIGPHPVAMFEVDIFTTEQFGAFIPWLVINRGPLSALVHPNTDDMERDHSQRAMWMGQPFPVNLRLFKEGQT